MWNTLYCIILYTGCLKKTEFYQIKHLEILLPIGKKTSDIHCKSTNAQFSKTHFLRHSKDSGETGFPFLTPNPALHAQLVFGNTIWASLGSAKNEYEWEKANNLGADRMSLALCWLSRTKPLHFTHRYSNLNWTNLWATWALWWKVA